MVGEGCSVFDWVSTPGSAGRQAVLRTVLYYEVHVTGRLDHNSKFELNQVNWVHSGVNSASNTP